MTAWHFYHQDDQGNVVALLDASGAVVERYRDLDHGAPRILDSNYNSRGASAYGNPYYFTGRRWDAETGIYYFRHRYYDPTNGRFTTRDPIGIWNARQDMRSELLRRARRDREFIRERARHLARTEEEVRRELGDFANRTRQPDSELLREHLLRQGHHGGFEQALRVNEHLAAERISTKLEGRVEDSVSGRTSEGIIDLRPSLERIARGEKYPHYSDGSTYRNNPNRATGRRLLPEKPEGYYREFVVPTQGISDRPGPQRLIIGAGGETYWTGNHYESATCLTN